MMQSFRQAKVVSCSGNEFETRIQPCEGALPHFETFTWQKLISAKGDVRDTKVF